MNRDWIASTDFDLPNALSLVFSIPCRAYKKKFMTIGRAHPPTHHAIGRSWGTRFGHNLGVGKENATDNDTQARQKWGA